MIAITGPIFWLWTVLAVELTLVWNHVEGVYTVKSTGQIIALVAGLGILVRMFWILRREHKVSWSTHFNTVDADQHRHAI